MARVARDGGPSEVAQQDQRAVVVGNAATASMRRRSASGRAATSSVDGRPSRAAAAARASRAALSSHHLACDVARAVEPRAPRHDFTRWLSERGTPRLLRDVVGARLVAHEPLREPSQEERVRREVALVELTQVGRSIHDGNSDLRPAGAGRRGSGSRRRRTALGSVHAVTIRAAIRRSHHAARNDPDAHGPPAAPLSSSDH
jgi:hypothetical protein